MGAAPLQLAGLAISQARSVSLAKKQTGVEKRADQIIGGIDKAFFAPDCVI